MEKVVVTCDFCEKLIEPISGKEKYWISLKSRHFPLLGCISYGISKPLILQTLDFCSFKCLNEYTKDIK